jgi:hypothetical protein
LFTRAVSTNGGLATDGRSRWLAAPTNVCVPEFGQQLVSLFDPGLPIGAIAASAATAAVHVQAAVSEFTLSDGWCCRGVDRLGGNWSRQDNSEHKSFHGAGLLK